MAKRKEKEVRPYSYKRIKSQWRRTGGGIGDDSMDRGSEYDADGCGVQGPIKNVGADPNEGISLKKHEGAE